MPGPTLPSDINGEALMTLAPGAHQSAAYTGVAGTIGTPVGQTNGTATILSNNTNVAADDNIVIGSVTYTFKAALTPTAGEVLRGANADASLLNLIRAINHTGTPGVDYANLGVTAVAHPQVSAAAAVTAHSFVITRLSSGLGANDVLITTPVGATLDGSSASTSGGIESAAVNIARVVLTSAGYVLMSSAGTAATTAAVYMPADTPEYFALPRGYYVSAIQASAGGSLHVTEMI